jgi:ADP-heptose:LPS heptosyltransferase
MGFLQERHRLSIVLTASMDAAEQQHLTKIKKSFSGPCIDLSGKTNLLQLAGVIRRASLFCGVDTAAMHLADAMKTPTIALFGPTNPFHWRPRHTGSIVLRADTDEPFSPAQSGGPMEHLSADSVSEVLKAQFPHVLRKA